MNIGQPLMVIGLLFSSLVAIILAIAELKIKREVKALTAEKWQPHPEVAKLLRERRKYALIAVMLLLVGFVLQLAGTIML